MPANGTVKTKRRGGPFAGPRKASRQPFQRGEGGKGNATGSGDGHTFTFAAKNAFGFAVLRRE